MSLNVLLVEDNDADAYTIGSCLDASPDVDSHVRAKNGEEAIAILKEGKFRPKLILLDLSMPRMDGFEFINQYNERFRRRKAKIAILTSSSRGIDYHRSLARKAATFITKPSVYSELRNCISSICQRVAGEEPLSSIYYSVGA